MNIRPGGFSEAGLCTADLEGWAAFLAEFGGYRELWRGETPDALLRYWGCGRGVTARECLLGRPGHSTGLIRLFELDGIEQQAIRRGVSCRDSGGIFDLDMRVAQLHPLVAPLRANGWAGVSDPVDWPFGAVRVREWLTTGPDDVVLALIQRLEPPLENLTIESGFGHVFNSSQVVADINRAVDFYSKLGFEILLDHRGPLEGAGGEVLGLAPELAPKTPVDLVIMQPRGEMDGSVELVRIHGEGGGDVSDRARPWNRGLNLLRFPVDDATAYREEITGRGIRPVGDSVIRLALQPGGETDLFAVRTPDGAWLEFYRLL